MKIDCNECRQRLGDALDKTATPEAHGALAEHLAACDSCRAELKLLQAARAELRAFPVLVAPADLRSRVRTQLETAPIPPKHAAQHGADPKIITAPAKISSTSGPKPKYWSEPEPNWFDKFRAILRNPTTITWASCCVLLLFYLISLSRPPQPTGQYKEIERAPFGEQYEKRFDKENAGESKTYKSPYRYEPYFKPMPKQAEPGRSPDWAPPDLPSGALPAPATKPAPSKSAPPKPDSKPDTPDSRESASIQESSPKPQTPKSRPAAPAPKSSQDSIKDSNSNKDSDSGSSAKARTRARDDAREAAPAAAPPSMQKSQNSYLSRSTPGGGSGPAAAASKADRAQESNDAPQATATRKISTRFTPPSSASWAQISVVLSGGARFADGQTSHIIWRGAAQANEPIDLDFSVQTTESGNAKITLQEVKNGQAQTIAYKNVVIDVAR